MLQDVFFVTNLRVHPSFLSSVSVRPSMRIVLTLHVWFRLFILISTSRRL